MKNKLIIIGWTGTRTAYLNITKEEAIMRYLKDDDVEYNQENIDKILEEGIYEEQIFDDEFYMY